VKKLWIALVVLALMGGVGWILFQRWAHPPADTDRLVPAFAAAPAALRARIDDAIRGVKSGDYGASVQALQTAEEQGRLSEDQRQTLLYTLTEIRSKITEQSDDQARLLNQIDELTLKLMSPPE
jgi:hypothetical protein